MTPKEYLSQAYKIDRQINLKIAKLNSLRASLYGRATNYETDGTQHVASGNSVENALHKVLEYEDQINAEIDKLVDLKLEIEDAVSKIADAEQREILERRYMCQQPYETRYDKRTRKIITGIADDMFCSEIKVYKLHRIALKEFAIVNSDKLKMYSEI